MPISQKERIILALKHYKEMEPYKGKIKERKAKLRWLFKEMKIIYDKPDAELLIAVPHRFSRWYNSGLSHQTGDVIVLSGRLSTLTFLHEFGHLLYGTSESKAHKFSEELFKEVFPEKLEKLKRAKHPIAEELGMLVKPKKKQRS